MRDEIEYFFADLDMHLGAGKKPLDALVSTVEDYAAVYHVNDDRTVLARAATVALKHLLSEEAELDPAT